MRILLAFRVFFAILFGLPLPPEIADLPLKELPEGTKRPTPIDVAEARAALTASKAEVEAVAAPKVEPPKVEPPKVEVIDDPRRAQGAAVQVLAVLQAEGRLLDFLSEDIEGYGDADVGAAVRDIHRGLRRAMADHFPVQPLRKEEEGAPLTVPEGFDPSQIRLTGNVIGKPPFSGKLKHRGWRVTDVRLPRVPNGDAAFVAAPAEVEL